MTDFEAEFARRNSLLHALAMAPCLRDHLVGMRATAQDSLIRHLPSLRADDGRWVRPEELQALACALDPDNPELTLALLDALAQVGDRTVLRRVEALSTQVAGATHGPAGRLRTAAIRCMERLRERDAQARHAESLLRGSEPPAVEAESILLRPVRDPVPTAAAELLRPGDADGQ